jgi:hypothetical protein
MDEVYPGGLGGGKGGGENATAVRIYMIGAATASEAGRAE